MQSGVDRNVMLAVVAGLSLWTWAGSAVMAQVSPPAEEPPPIFGEEFLNDPKIIEAGKAVWDMQCRHCHGSSAYPGKAPKLRPGAYTPDLVYDRVTYGFRKMPSWKAVFSLEQRMAVAAYVKSDSFSP